MCVVDTPPHRTRLVVFICLEGERNQIADLLVVVPILHKRKLLDPRIFRSGLFRNSESSELSCYSSKAKLGREDHWKTCGDLYYCIPPCNNPLISFHLLFAYFQFLHGQRFLLSTVEIPYDAMGMKKQWDTSSECKWKRHLTYL